MEENLQLRRIEPDPETEALLSSLINNNQLSIEDDNEEFNVESLESFLFNEFDSADVVIETQQGQQQPQPEEEIKTEIFEIFTVNEKGELIPDDFQEQSEEAVDFFTSSIRLMNENQQLIKSLMPKDPETAKTDRISCTKCCREFVHEGGLHRHWDIHVGEILPPNSHDEYCDQPKQVIICVLCGEIFGNSSAVFSHLRKFHINISHSFETKILLSENSNEVGHGEQKPEKDLKSHQLCGDDVDKIQPVEENTSKQLCKIDNVESTYSSLDIIRLVHVAKCYQCEFCESLFCDVNAMLIHSSMHSSGSAFHCNTCELKELTLKDLLLHRRDECSTHKDVRNSLRNLPTVWVCNVCSVEFKGLEQLFLHRHEELHFIPRHDPKTNELSFHCEICSFICTNAQVYIDHYKEKHQKKPKLNEISETSERVPKPPSTTRRGGSHQTSTRPRQFLCEVCGKSYTQSSHLWQHLRFHQGVKPFECKVDGCDRKFTIRPDLNDHIRKCHTGERPYLCTICNKRFLTGSVFYQHRLIHRGERRYGCEECGKRFYRADALKNHLRIHSGEKPHVCNVCDKAFRQRGDRDKHVKARHPDAPIFVEPKKPRVKSFGRGRIRNNTSLYESKPTAEAVAKVQGTKKAQKEKQHEEEKD